MSRKAIVKSRISEFGQNVKITIPSQDNKTIKTRAFIQPLRQTRKAYQWNISLDSGFIDLSNYIYIGPYDVRLDNFPDDTILESNTKKYTIQKTDTLTINDEIIYVWAVLQVCTET